MLAFIVPVRPLATTPDWEDASFHLRQCLHSLLSQTSGEFHIFCVYHELPERLPQDPRITYLQVTFQPPDGTTSGALEDVAKKRLLGISSLDSRFSHFMLVDSDDRVSKNLAAFVLKGRASIGWYVGQGYHWSTTKRALSKWINFSEFCGTSIVYPISARDILLNSANPIQGMSNEFSHNRVISTLSRSGIEFEPLPFPAVVYVYTARNNLSYRRFYFWFWGWKRRLRSKATPVEMTTKIAREFYLVGDDQLQTENGMGSWLLASR